MVAIILLVGWTAAALLYVTAPSPPEGGDEVYELEHSKKYLREVERIGGKAGVLTNDLSDWLASLWEGRMRACTTAVVTALVAGAYVLLARAARPAAEE